MYIEWKMRYVAALNEAFSAGQLPRSGRVTTISTKQGVSSIVDEEDEWATLLTWHAHKSGKNLYLCTTFTSGLHVNLHSIILPPRARLPKLKLAIDVHHIDGDSLNNTRANLCYALHSENITAGWTLRRRHEGPSWLYGDPPKLLRFDGQTEPAE